jgi:aminoglycoside phosphotransferase (APT) family kinase protein
MDLLRDTRSTLTQSSIAHYLLSLGIVKPRDVVDDELSVLDASRRNAVFIAAARSGPAYVVKQARAQTAGTLRREATMLRALAAKPELHGLVPEVLHEDREAACLVLRSPPDAGDWSQHQAIRRFPRSSANALGRALACLHALPVDGIDGLPAGPDPLWGLTLPEPPHELLLDLSAAALDLLGRLQDQELLCARLRELHGAISSDAIVHGDLRWDNCMAVAAPGARRRTRVLLVDWELSGRGPAGFDIGTALAEYVSAWVGSIPMPDPRDPSRFVDHARYPVASMRPAIRTLWTAYRSARDRPPALAQVVQLAGVRLLQAALERARHSDELSAHAVVLAQVAAHLLSDPEGTALALLGLHE